MRLLIPLCLLLCLTVPITAQEKTAHLSAPTPEELAKASFLRNANWIKSHIKLTKAQEKKYSIIPKSYIAIFKEIDSLEQKVIPLHRKQRLASTKEEASKISDALKPIFEKFHALNVKQVEYIEDLNKQILTESQFIEITITEMCDSTEHDLKRDHGFALSNDQKKQLRKLAKPYAEKVVKNTEKDSQRKMVDKYMLQSSLDREAKNTILTEEQKKEIGINEPEITPDSLF